MRHLYNIVTINGEKRVEGKKALLEYLKEISPCSVIKIEWYVSNGFWNDVTKKYMK